MKDLGIKTAKMMDKRFHAAFALITSVRANASGSLNVSTSITRSVWMAG